MTYAVVYTPAMCLAAAMDGRDLPICVDARMVDKSGTGITTYARGLIAAAGAVGRPFLLLRADHEADSRSRKLLGALSGEHALRQCDTVREEVAGEELVGRDIFRRAHVHFTLRRRFLQLKPPRPFGIMHWTYPVPMRMARWINIYTVHDAIPLTQPDLSPISSRRHRAVMRQLLLHADRIVTVSQAARKDILSSLQVEESLVVNCGQAVLGTADELKAGPPLGLEAGGYFVFCGAVEPRKNLARLIEAHARSGVDKVLVIAGPDGWRAAEINRLIESMPSVRRSGYLERAELLALIRHARGLLFPSLAEGFGLPVAEAMRLGTPVLTSSSGALAEIAGDAALLVDPTDISAIAAGIRLLAFDDGIVADLSSRGLIRAQRFLLPSFVERLATVYDEALAPYSQPAPTRQRVR
ncbi:glycosyltransferase family 1 protein [Novosphingobium sp. RD2P27]|uniref:Glycosyltransferase family 1 protein n=1 Tax=Novosphingobium kalidii TaxID=3230299 RepID=A0ABV2D4U6_9SPHN